MKDVTEICISPGATLREVLERSNATRRGIILAVDSNCRLIGVITDGDVRRAILAGIDLGVTVAELLATKSAAAKPITASSNATHSELVAIQRRTSVSHIPLVDGEGRVTGLVTLEDLLDEDELALQAVVMAGGRGTRLRPLTEEMPKPMLPVGGRPLMERIIRKLADTGIRQVNITTHYLAEKIVEHFGDGRNFGVDINYVPEDRLLGTAGGLGLMPVSDKPLLVINGDILTEVDFRAMLGFHREQRAMLTMAVRPYEVEVPYGVVESDGPSVRRVVEKPTYKYFVNAGIYLLEPAAHRMIPKDQRFDMTDLVQAVIAAGLKVTNFPIWEYWRDIGRHEDYLNAQSDAQDGTFSS